jgi:hypothetical protein
MALRGFLHLAMVQCTVYDAANAIDGGYQPYLAGLPEASPTDSVDSAVATAAHDVLVGQGLLRNEQARVHDPQQLLGRGP